MLVNTVKSVLKDCPIAHKKYGFSRQVVFGESSIAPKCGTFCQEYVVLQDRWSLIVAVCQYCFHCTGVLSDSHEQTVQVYCLSVQVYLQYSVSQYKCTHSIVSRSVLTVLSVSTGVLTVLSVSTGVLTIL